jgi:Dolichyl-phosphate-mannose-protein mannosyltransferase/F5/8 type C domain
MIPVLALLAAGLGLRLLYLAAPALDSDQAIFGLMAMHILRGELPIFQWGYHYMGTIESFVAAPLMLVFGPTRFALNLSPVLFSMLFAGSAYLFARDAAGRTAGLWALAFACFPPIYLVWTVVVARGAYSETLALGTLAFYLALRAVNAESPREERRALFGAGLALGVSFWTHFITVIYGSAIFLFWLIERPALLRRAVVWAGGAFLLGSAPFWYGTILFHFDTFRVTGPLATPLGPRVTRLLAYRLPIVLGVAFDRGTVPTVPLLSWLIVPLQGSALAFVAWQARASAPAAARRAARLLLIGVLMLFSTYLASSFSAANTQRYLVPLYTVLTIAPALFYSQLGVAGIVLSSTLLALQAAPDLLQAPVLDPKAVAQYRAERASESRMFAALKGLGLTAVYADQYWDGARFTFDARESIIFATRFDDRSDVYLDRVDGAPNAAFLFHDHSRAAEFESTLHLASATFQKTPLEGFTLFHGITPAPAGGSEIRVVGATASHNPTDASLALDRDAVTLWTTLEPMRPGMWLTLDLGAGREIAEVSFFPRLALDAPRGLRVEISTDGTSWRTLKEASLYWGPCSWARGRPLPARDGWVVVRFFPARGRFVRLTQLGTDRFYSWSVAEVVVRAPGPPHTSDVPALRPELSRLFADPVAAARLSGAVRRWQGELLEHYEHLRDQSLVGPTDRLLVFPTEPLASGGDDRIGARAASIAAADGEVLVRGVRLDTEDLARLEPESWRFDAAGQRAVIDLATEDVIAGVIVSQGVATASFPRGLTARTSDGGASWSEPEPLLPRPSRLIWTDEGLFGASFSDRIFLFPAPRRARRIELIAAPQHPKLPWQLVKVTLLRAPQG